jgi:competence protein ComEC
MSHPHDNYIGGVPYVLESLPVKRVLDNAYPYESKVQSRILETIEDEQIPYYAAQTGQKLSVGRDLDIFVLWPGRKFLSETRDDVNNNSVVLQLVFGRIKFLFTGDIEREAEGELIASRQNMESNVLKVAHNGSNNSSSLEFLRMVKPDFVVISVGQGNPYHYPHSKTLERLNPEKLGAELYRTDQSGTIAVRTDGKAVVVETEQ